LVLSNKITDRRIVMNAMNEIISTLNFKEIFSIPEIPACDE